MNGSKLFRVLSVCLLWLFLAVPFLLVLFDWASTREREHARLEDLADQNALTRLQEIQVSGSSEYQVINRLTDFQRQLRGRLKIPVSQAASLTADLYQQHLQKILPPHHILIAVRNKSDQALTIVFSGATASGTSLLPDFVPLMDEEPCTDEQYRTAGASLFAMTGFPVEERSIPGIQSAIRGKDEGIMLPFTSRKGCTWLYWFYPLHAEQRIFVCALFDQAAVPADYAFRALAESVDSKDQGIAILPFSGSARPNWSGFFADKPALRNFLATRSRVMPFAGHHDQFAGFKIFSAPLLVGESAFAVLVKPGSAAKALSFIELTSLIILSLLFVSLSLILWERKMFQRGWRISIGLVLFTAIFSIFYLPAAIGRLVAQYSIDSHVAELKKVAETDLERNLQNLEDRFHLSMGDFFYRLHHLEDYPGIIPAIREGRLFDALATINATVKSKYPHEFSNSMIFASMQKDDGTSKLRIKHSENKDLGDMFGPLFRGLMLKFRPDIARLKQSNDGGLSLQDVKNEMITDFLVQFFQGVLGRELYHNLMANPVGLIEARSTFTMAATSVIPIRYDGAVRALLLAIWSEYQEEEEYLDFLIGNKSERPENFDFMALRKSYFQDYSRQSSSFPAQAWVSADKARRVEIQLTSRELLASESLLIKSRQGNSLGFYILTGMTSLKSIFARQLQLEKGFNNMVFAGLAALLILIVIVYRFFMSPLRRLQQGLENIQRGDFHARLPLAGRNDEFDRIGDSFNSMARGLEEGSLLGKFVSSAVMNVVRNKEAFARALAGERRQMTILFASIRIASGGQSEEFFKLLDLNLRACQEALRNTSGVIDKVMEEKIMIFFDHEACGGSGRAAATCLQTVLTVNRLLNAQGNAGYFGMATGPAVAGVLGARNIRLDYTVIGDAVNLAARLNSMAKGEAGPSIIADEKTRGLVSQTVAAVSLGFINIKGKQDPVQAFHLTT